MQWLFREVHGYRVWAWLLVAGVIALLITGIVLGWDMSRCDSHGSCLYEY